MAKRPELLIVSEPLAGKRYAITADGLRLGRSSSNDIHVPDEELSRNHCLFERVDEDAIRVTDLASANGTILNGRMLGGAPARLKVGDVIEVGATTIKVVGDEEPPPRGAGGAVDLGFGAPANVPAVKSGRKRSPFANVLWAFAILLAVAAIYLVFKSDSIAKPPAPTALKTSP